MRVCIGVCVSACSSAYVYVCAHVRLCVCVCVCYVQTNAGKRRVHLDYHRPTNQALRGSDQCLLHERIKACSLSTCLVAVHAKPLVLAVTTTVTVNVKGWPEPYVYAVYGRIFAEGVDWGNVQVCALFTL